MRKVVIIVDGNNFSFANYHTHRELSTSDGVPTGLIYGCLEGILKIGRLFPRCPIVMVWDGPGRSWRKIISPDRYKAQRPSQENGSSARADCMTQIAQLGEILDYLQIPQLKVAHVEADDLIGILSAYLKKSYDHVIIRSSDKDFYQLLDDKVSVLRGQSKQSNPRDSVDVWDHLITHKNIPQNISPKRWTTFRALCGDSSDNLKGLVHGCGEMAAAAVVETGLKLPAKGCPSLKKIARLGKKEITSADWERVNENYLLSTILTDYKDDRIPNTAQREIANFLQTRASKGFKRQVDRIDEWTLRKMLGRYEMLSLTAHVRSLMRLF